MPIPAPTDRSIIPIVITNIRPVLAKIRMIDCSRISRMFLALRDAPPLAIANTAIKKARPANCIRKEPAFFKYVFFIALSLYHVVNQILLRQILGAGEFLHDLPVLENADPIAHADQLGQLLRNNQN